MKKFKYLEVIKFSPDYKVEKHYPIQKDESVLFLGYIPNVKGHCAVAKHDGKVVWLMHPEDFRKAKKAEL